MVEVPTAQTGKTIAKFLITGYFFQLLQFEQKKREILDRVDIVEIVSEQVTLKRSGRRLVGLCPFHAEKTPSFTVTPEMGFYKCFGCGQGGDVFSFVQARENVSFSEAMHILADRVGVELGSAKPSASTGPSRADIARVNNWAMRFFQSNLNHEKLGASTRQYLQDRNFSAETLETFGVGLVTDQTPSILEAASRAKISNEWLEAADLIRKGDDGRIYQTFRNRIMFPIRDATKRVIGFGGRTLVEDRAKYLNTRQNTLYDKGRNLYAVDVARDSIVSKKRAVLVEGYTDCLAAHQAGFTETVATLGTALTPQQVDLLRRYCDEIILLFDSDTAGEEAADRAIRVAMPRCVTCRLARIPDGKDPSEFLSRNSKDSFSDVLNAAIDALEFKWKRTSQRFAQNHSDAQRREAVLEFLQVVAEGIQGQAIDVIQRGLLINQVAHLLRLPREEVDRLLSKITPRREPQKLTSTPATNRDREPSPSGEQSAWSRVLEVLLNEPGAFSAVKEWPNVEKIANTRDRRIATCVLELLQKNGSMTLTDVLARCQDPSDAIRIEELTRRGAQRGNYEATLQVALAQLIRADRNEAFQPDANSSVEQTNETVNQETVDQETKEHRHFVPRRMTRHLS